MAGEEGELVTYLIVTAAAMAVLAIILYNGLVRARLRVREAWSAVDVQLQRRASLIPNLVSTVKGYAAYERDTITRVVQSRAALTAAEGPRAAAAANAQLTAALGSLFALSEAYPDLKANQSYLLLQNDLSDTENKIAFARNYYNGASRIQHEGSRCLVARRATVRIRRGRVLHGGEDARLQWRSMSGLAANDRKHFVPFASICAGVVPSRLSLNKGSVFEGAR